MPHYMICQCLSLSTRDLVLFPGKDVYKQLVTINNELSKSSLGSVDTTTLQWKWVRNKREKLNDGISL